MRKTLYIIAVLFGLFACEEDLDFSSPEIETLGAEADGNGKLYLFGRADGGTYGHPEIMGFCYSFDSNPSLKSKQILVYNRPKDFYATFNYNLSGDTMYYRALASDYYGGISLGETKSVLLPAFDAPSVPCQIADNTVEWEFASNPALSFNVSGAYIYTRNLSYGHSRVEIPVNSPGPDVYLNFSIPVEQGLYTTVNYGGISDSDTNDRLVYVRFHHPFDIPSADKGQEVYVTKLPNGKFQFEFCDLSYSLDGFDYKMSAKAISN